MIRISAKITGTKKPCLKNREIELPAEIAGPGSPLDLGTLIAAIVREEVSSFEKRQRQRKLVEILTEKQIDDALETGKVAMGGQTLDPEQPIDAEKAVANALEAFEDGLYFVFIDDKQYCRLKDPVVLNEGSNVMFLRLIALAGGYF